MNFLKCSSINFIYRSQLSRTFFTSLQFKNNYSEVLISSWKTTISRIVTTKEEILFPTPLQLLSITLNRKEIINNIPSTQTPPDETPLPPNYHLVYFNPSDYEHELSNDGYNTLYSPPPPFLRRMWAGGELKFNHKNQLRIGQKAKMTTKLRDAEYKIGKLGENVFVWLDINISNDNGWCIKDTRCFAYVPSSENLSPEFEKVILPTSMLLFRYSALTFNSHRIHYDHIYSTEIEGYPGCLVHGPLTCTLLLDLIRDNLPSSSYIKSFKYKALSPLYVGEEFKVCGKKGHTDNTSLDVWAENIQGGVAMKGTAIIGDT
ncbi:23885_t:CDS:2 [Racocetra persica]|uniref:23885_t:CDS:1 n=1 Tax=Racocetra persica TaxID=160502 RepID=A0ACA9Q352_9GLOM|nr:23885_t:CDS:2 [Racocetra persica]